MATAASGLAAVKHTGAVEFLGKASHHVDGRAHEGVRLIASAPHGKRGVVAQAHGVALHGLFQQVVGLHEMAVPAGGPLLQHEDAQLVADIIEGVGLGHAAAPCANHLHMLLPGNGEEALIALAGELEHHVHSTPACTFDKHVAPVDAEQPLVALGLLLRRQRQRLHLDGAYAEAGGAYRLHFAVLDKLHLSAVEVLFACVVRPPQLRVVDVEIKGHIALRVLNGGLVSLALAFEVVGRDKQPYLAASSGGEGDAEAHVAVVMARHDKRILYAVGGALADEHIVPDAQRRNPRVVPAIDAVDHHGVLPTLVGIASPSAAKDADAVKLHLDSVLALAQKGTDGYVGAAEHALVLANHLAIEPYAAFVGYALETEQRVGHRAVVLEGALQSPSSVGALLCNGVVATEARVRNGASLHQRRVDATRHLCAYTDALTIVQSPFA